MSLVKKRVEIAILFDDFCWTRFMVFKSKVCRMTYNK